MKTLDLDKYNRKEELLYSKLFSALDWSVDENNVILKGGFIPLIIMNKPVIKYAKYTKRQLHEFKDKYIIFRPLRVKRHCSVLVDHVLHFCEDVENLYTRRNMDNKYIGYITFEKGGQFASTTLERENECRFNLCYYLLTDTECDHFIDKVNAAAEKDVEERKDGIKSRAKES